MAYQIPYKPTPAPAPAKPAPAPVPPAPAPAPPPPRPAPAYSAAAQALMAQGVSPVSDAQRQAQAAVPAAGAAQQFMLQQRQLAQAMQALTKTVADANYLALQRQRQAVAKAAPRPVRPTRIQQITGAIGTRIARGQRALAARSRLVGMRQGRAARQLAAGQISPRRFAVGAAGRGIASAGLAIGRGALGLAGVALAPAAAVATTAANLAPAAQGLARGGPSGDVSALTGAANAAAQGLGAIFPVAGAVAGALVSVAKGAKDLVDSFIARGKEIEKFSPQLVAANVRAELRTMQGEQREAEVLGPALANLVDANTTFEATLRETLMPIKKFLIEQLTGFLEFMTDALNTIRGGIAAVHEAILVSIEVAEKIGELEITQASKIAADAPERIGRAFAEASKPIPEPGAMAWDKWLGEVLIDFKAPRPAGDLPALPPSAFVPAAVGGP